MTCIIPLNRDAHPAHLPLVTKAGASTILHKLRRDTKSHVAFLVSPVPGLPSHLRMRLALTDRRQPAARASPIRSVRVCMTMLCQNCLKSMLCA
jgi:hypothetical protein